MIANFLGNELFSNPNEARPATGVSPFPAQFTCPSSGAIIDSTTQLLNMAEKLPVEVSHFYCFCKR
jgi:hypothetical protein